ncbi:MAG: hypothetical protein J6V05_05270 [Alistipes sp.]|nr:hypothetical protein [Alistipes sp.]
MPRKILAPIVIVSLLCGVMFYAASGHSYHSAIDYDSLFVAPEQKSSERHMVDMLADDSYLIEQGDSTIFILVGNFAAHHNGTVILADSAVRYPNQSFECFGNVLINQNDTYAYGDRAEYDRGNSVATIYSDLVKIVDGDATMYTYYCTFDTEEEIGYFYDGCYVMTEDSQMEAERGYYYTDTHNLIAVESVEMRDSKYLMKGDSVIFNTQTEDAQYFTNTNIWNDKGEYLYADEGEYIKATDLHRLTRNAYLLSEEREVWSDTIEYYRTTGHVIGRNNIQMDDTTQKVLGFADYGEWWDDLDNALFTQRPSMINYNPDEPDSLFLCADTLWLYTIPVLPPADTLNRDGATRDAERSREESSEESVEKSVDSLSTDTPEAPTEESAEEEASVTESKKERKSEEATPDKRRDEGERQRRKSAKDDEHRDELRNEEPRNADTPTSEQPRDNANNQEAVREHEGKVEEEASAERRDSIVADTLQRDTLVADTLLGDTLSEDSIKVLTKKQLRYRARLERRRVRDSIRTAKRIVQDSIDSVKQIELDSIKHIKDSLLRIEIDSIIAKRRAQSAKLADEEKARMERVKQRTEERNRRKIDKAKARALKRGKVYDGPDYVIDSITTDSIATDSTFVDTLAMDARDTLATDSLTRDTLARDSLTRDTLITPPFPEDSVYKMIKAYRHVKMYRSDSQMVCDSLVLLNTDSIIRLYREPVMWNEDNQITSDSMAIYTRNEKLTKAHFMGDPLMGMEIDTMYYNQVGGKDMIAYFADGEVYRNDVNGNAQTIYYMQEEDSPEVTGLMYIESASISFYLVEGEIDKIAYKQNPTYVLYPMDMIPETQELRLKDFNWFYDRRPERDSVFDRSIRGTRRADVANKEKPRFRITERIDYDRRRLVENRMWQDRVDELSPEIIEWRNTRSTYPNKE